MGIIKKDAVRTTLISYIGLALGYVNKGVLFVIFLTDEQIGILSLLMTAGLLFAQFSNLGVAYAVWRFFPFLRNKEKKNFGFFQMSMSVNLIGVLLFLLVSILLKDFICKAFNEHSPAFVDYYYWLLPIGIAYSFFLTIDNFLRSLHKNVVSVLATELLMRLVVTFGILAYVFNWIGFFELMVIHSFSFLVPGIVVLIQLYKNKELHWKWSEINIPGRFKKIMIAYSVFSYFNFLFILIVLSLDVIMLGSMVGLKETGVYSTIVFIVSGLLVPYKSLQRISAPFIAKYWKERNMTEMQDLYVRTSSISLVIGFLVFLLFWVNRVEFFSFLRESFQIGIPIFLVLMIGRLYDMYCGINGYIFLSSKKYRVDLIFSILFVGIIIGANLLFIPKFGAVGAALSATIGYLFYNTARLLYVYLTFGLHPFKRSQGTIILFFVLTLAVVGWLPVIFGNPYISIIIKGILVLTLFLLPVYLGKLDKDVHEFMRKILVRVLPK